MLQQLRSLLITGSAAPTCANTGFHNQHPPVGSPSSLGEVMSVTPQTLLCLANFFSCGECRGKRRDAKYQLLRSHNNPLKVSWLTELQLLKLTEILFNYCPQHCYDE